MERQLPLHITKCLRSLWLNGGQAYEEATTHLFAT